MRSSIVSLGLATVIGIVIGLLLQTPDSSKQSTNLPVNSNSSPTDTQGLNLTDLSQQLQQEITARQALQKEVAALGKKLDVLSPEEAQEISDNHTAASIAEQVETAHTSEKNVWFNQQALIDAGMEQAEAEQLKARFEKMELEKLYLRDQAVREGWSGGKRYREERQKLEDKTDNIKQELGEDAYDAYLFASGQPNRVAVQSVLSGSSAGNAGIVSGDQIIRYDSQRIYNGRDLRTATTQGDLSESIGIGIIRGGKTLEVYVQRGPLGIRMTSVSIAPDF